MVCLVLFSGSGKVLFLCCEVKLVLIIVIIVRVLIGVIG